MKVFNKSEKMELNVTLNFLKEEERLSKEGQKRKINHKYVA